MNKKIIGIAVIIIVLLSGILLFFKTKGKKVSYKTTELERGNISSIVEATGELKPTILVEVGCQVTGKIEKIYVDYNSRVKKGQLLAKIDPTKYEAQVLNKKASLAQAQETLLMKSRQIDKSKLEIKKIKSKVEKNKVLATDKKRTYNRYKVLIEKNLISQSQVDTSETEYLAAQEDLYGSLSELKGAEIQYKIDNSEYELSKSALEKARADLDNALADLDYTNITSPIDGIVIARKVDEGQTVVSSYQSTTLFQIAKDLTQMEVHTKVNESDIGAVAQGQNASIEVDAYSGKVFSGKIIQIRDEAMDVDKTIYYDAIISVNNPELILKPGMTAKVEIKTSFKENVLKIPNEALRFIPKTPELQEKLKDLRAKESSLKTESGQSKGVVWILENKVPEPVEVILGVSDNKFTEFIAGPLKESDKLVTREVDKKK